MNICTFCKQLKEGWDMDMGNNLWGFICIACLQEECDGDCLPHVIYGELRAMYLRGYRDAKEGKEEQI